MALHRQRVLHIIARCEIFVAEAHQRLAALQDEANRHADMAGSAVSEQARRAVHTLGGIAGTAGITVMSELSQALEQYWNRFVHIPLPSSHVSLVQDTVGRLHEMIATVEGGHLPEAANDLIATLGELGDEQSLPDAPVVELATPLADDAADDVVAEVGTLPAEGVVVETLADTTSPGAPAATERAPSPLDISALVPDFKVATPSPVFERREVTDEIDQQLLPIFLDEADTLLPDTSAQHRATIAASNQAAANDALSRNIGGGGGGGTGGTLQVTGAGRYGLTEGGQAQLLGYIKGFDMEKHADVSEAMKAVFDEVERPDAVDTSAILTLQAAGGLKGTIVSNILTLFRDIEPLLSYRMNEGIGSPGGSTSYTRFNISLP